MRIQTSDFANIGIKGYTSWAEKKKCWSTFAKKLQVKRVKWKFLVDFHEDSNLRSTGLLLYTLPAEVYKTRSAIVLLFAFRLLLECVINRLYRCSFVLCWRETPDQFKLVFKPAIWVTKQQDFTHDESCLPDQVRIKSKISTIHEVWLYCPKSIKLAIFKYRYQIYNWNF